MLFYPWIGFQDFWPRKEKNWRCALSSLITVMEERADIYWHCNKYRTMWYYFVMYCILGFLAKKEVQNWRYASSSLITVTRGRDNIYWHRMDRILFLSSSLKNHDSFFSNVGLPFLTISTALSLFSKAINLSFWKMSIILLQSYLGKK